MDEKIKDTFENITNTEDTTNQFAQEDIEQNKIMAVLAYIGILFLVPLLAAKESNFARFHTNQGIILFIAGIASGIVTGILTTILLIIPFIGPIIAALISFVLSAVCFVLMIIGIINAATGKAKKLPLIGNLFTIIK